MWDKLVKWCVFEAPYQWSFASLAMLEPVASAGNDTSRDLVFELLRPLKRVLIVSHQTTGPIPTANAENTFVDPSDTSVCWLNRSSSRSGMSGWCRRRTR